MTSEPDLYAVVMAGGSGTRFWPASRAARPKQFLPVASGRTLLADTVARLAGLVPLERVLVVAGARHAQLVRESLPRLAPENVLCEPEARNTLPCIALAAVEIARRAPDAVQVVLPADHVIEPREAFQSTLRSAAEVARESGALVTLGVRPTRAETGYGWIEVGEALGETLGSEVFGVRRFIEKPAAARAAELLAAGNHYWNSGVFVWTTAAIRTALAEHAPATLSALEAAGPSDLPAAFAKLELVSIDEGVMQRARNVRLLPIAYGWSDVGSWPALEEVLPADDEGNLRAGAGLLMTEDAAGNVVWSAEGQLVALIGVRDLVVVHANGVTLVCPKERAQEVRLLVDRLKTFAPDKL